MTKWIGGLVDDKFSVSALLIYFAGGMFGGMQFATKPKYKVVSYTLEEAKTKSTEFNNNLKKELGLPEELEI
ncbi:MAG: hypothetical protein AB7V36_01610 [Bacteroidales bacterium]|jgi:hypothetical protein|nr:hypothetical protein [Bacteroidales bacterium]HPB01921.1 hypothetical protein [Bacteroidales bacterium]